MNRGVHCVMLPTWGSACLFVWVPVLSQEREGALKTHSLFLCHQMKGKRGCSSSVDGYDLFRKDRKGRGGSGVALCVKRGLAAQRLMMVTRGLNIFRQKLREGQQDRYWWGSTSSDVSSSGPLISRMLSYWSKSKEQSWWRVWKTNPEGAGVV